MAFFFILLISAVSLGWVYLRSDAKLVIQDQLSALHQKKIAIAYYNYVSKEFQSVTSLNQFNEFVEEQAIFNTYTSLKISEPSLYKGFASVVVILGNNLGEHVEILYELIKENFSWKILGIHINTISSDKDSATAEMIAPIESQLTSLKKKDILEAYKAPTSEEFMESTSFENFKTFIMRNPLLTQFDDYSYEGHSMRGKNGVITVLFNPDKEDKAVSLEYHVKQNENGPWKIQYMQIAEEGSATESNKPLSRAQMVSTIKQAIELLKKKEIKTFYNRFIAPEIKQSNSEDKFEQFFKINSVFTNYQSINIKDPYIENNRGLVTVELYNEEGVTTIEMSLKVVDNNWKITGIHIDKVPETNLSTEDKDAKGFKSRELINVIQSLLSSIQKGETAQAYKKFTSGYFQEANSLEQFKEFIEKHPELKGGSSSSFEKIMFNNDIATISGKLYLSNSVYIPVEFDLVQENGKWKILHIFTFPVVHQKVLPLSEKNAQASNESLVISKIIVGTKINGEGAILDPSLKLTAKTDDLYVNLFIQNGTSGISLTVTLRHVLSGSEMPPFTTTLTENGNSRLSFVFSPPPHGWPKGPYQLRVQSSTKDYKTFGFTIE